jgi:hypothetical protein
MKNYGRLIVGLIAVWFVFALTASAMHMFQNDGNRLGISVGIAALTPMVLFFAWFAGSRGFRQFLMSLDPVALTAVQAWRTIGFTFVLLEARNALPAVFAWPAGYGDMLIGATAAFAAWKLATPNRRNAFIAWQVLGIADLVLAVSLGTTAGLLRPQDVSMLPMTELPLSLIPTFLVPLFLMLHSICIAQARQWKSVPEHSYATVRPAQNAAI